jgi:hypothetical protein
MKIALLIEKLNYVTGWVSSAKFFMAYLPSQFSQFVQTRYGNNCSQELRLKTREQGNLRATVTQK